MLKFAFIVAAIAGSALPMLPAPSLAGSFAATQGQACGATPGGYYSHTTKGCATFSDADIRGQAVCARAAHYRRNLFWNGTDCVPAAEMFNNPSGAPQ